MKQLQFSDQNHELFLIGTKHEKTSIFSPKSWTIPFGKMPILWVFETAVFNVQKGLFSILNGKNLGKNYYGNLGKNRGKIY